jgi:DNA modification methylase
MANCWANRHSQTRKATYSEGCALCGAWRGDLGLEPDSEVFIRHTVEVFRECRRVLSRRGTLWIEIGDCYAGSHGVAYRGANRKQRMLIPQRLAIALQADGWICRQEIIWEKPNAMPESAADRPTTAHSTIWLFSRSTRYDYWGESITERATPDSHVRRKISHWKYGPGSHDPIDHMFPEDHLRNAPEMIPRDAWGANSPMNNNDSFNAVAGLVKCRSARTVWRIPTQGYRGHRAAFPELLAERMILASTAMGQTVLDPFAGSGTVAASAKRLCRNSCSIDVGPQYCRIINRRLLGVTPGLGI